MAYTKEYYLASSHLGLGVDKREWQVWDEPNPMIPDVVAAFRLYFLTSELMVPADARQSRKWKDVVFIESAPTGKMTAVTLFMTEGEPELRHASEPSFRLASLRLANGRYAQLIAHGEAESDIAVMVKASVAEAATQAEAMNVKLPPTAYGYFFGHQEDGARFIVGARVPSPID